MSFRVLVIPEDPTLDKYVLKPAIQAACREAGRPKAVVRVLEDPHAQGVDQALDADFVREVLSRNRLVDLYLFCIDRDGKSGRDAELRACVERTAALLGPSQSVDGRTAQQELEVWCLAVDHANLGAPWREVRAERDPKERFFDPLAEQLGVMRGPGRGREFLGRRAAAGYGKLRELCPELKEIEEIIRRP